MGVVLLSRTTKSVSLTEAGKVALEWLSETDRSYYEMIKKAVAAQEGFRGVITIGALAGQRIYGNYATMLNSFIKEYPDIKLELGTYDQNDVLQLLSEGGVDFAVGGATEYMYSLGI